MRLRILVTAAQILSGLPSVGSAQENSPLPDGSAKGRAPDCVALGHLVDPDAQVGGKVLLCNI